MRRDKLYLSTIDPEAGQLARSYGLGIEIAQFCTAWNLDLHFSETDTRVRHAVREVSRRVLHGPFNELYPCAIDPLARELAAKRFAQALATSEKYDARKLVLHGGFDAHMYYPCWYTEQSALFWQDFLQQHPGNYEICLENVLEDDPALLLDIVTRVNDPRLRLCLDVGHVNAYSGIPVMAWIDAWGGSLSHVHLHNNDGSADTHSALGSGTLPVGELLTALRPETTVTLEMPHTADSIIWLLDRGLLSE